MRSKNSPKGSCFRSVEIGYIDVVDRTPGGLSIMRKIGFMFMAVMLAAALLTVGTASAHVTVFPKETVQGASEKYTVRVPNEKELPTTKVEVRFPLDDVSVSRFEPKPGWKYEVAKDSTGKISSVVWTAAGDGVLPGEFVEFSFQAKAGDKAVKIAWKAYQTYKDGSVVEWVGADGSDKPASVTNVTAKQAGASTDSHGNTSTAAANTNASQPAASSTGAASQLPLYLSAAALVLSLAALFVAISRRSKPTGGR
jgi:uncharacterized protein YcnI